MWETCSDHPLLWTKPPSKYPSELVGNGLISPIKLTYNILKEAIAKTHDSIVSNAWSADQAKHYLWVFGVNNDTISSLIDHATNVKPFNAAERLKDRMPREYNILARHKQRYPLQYEQWRYPTAWTREMDIKQHVDVPRIMEWTKQRNKHNNFV